MTSPVDWIGKSHVGYVMNAEFSDDNATLIVELMSAIKSQFGDAVYCPPREALHITLLDWLAPLYDYGADKDELFARLQPDYDRIVAGAIAASSPISVHFDSIQVSPSTIYILGKDQGQFASIRQAFVSGVELLPGTKLPPTIVHSSLIRFQRPIPLETVRDYVAGLKLDITERIANFRLIRNTKEPNLEFEVLKRYVLGVAVE